MLDKIKALLQEVENMKAANAEELEALRIKYLSKKGEISALMNDFRNVAADQKREVGKYLNELKETTQSKINELKESFENVQTANDDIDLTRTAYLIELGTRHPLSLVKKEICDIFGRLGFSIAEGPEIEDDWHVFSSLNFAEDHPGVANGAMLYDRHEMKALFQLAIGRPGSSFAIEIARKIGLPEEVIKEASDIVGSEYIQSDKYLQDIVRDKRYWENKRQNIHQREKDMEKTISKYENDIEDIERSRKAILKKAKEEAAELLKESNKRIENAIREIKESQAEKEETRRIRQELDTFKQEVQEIDTKETDDKIARKIAQIQQRKERHAKRQAEKKENQEKAAAALRNAQNKTQADSKRDIQIGDTVRIKGLTTIGKIENITGDTATAVFGGMRTKMRLNRLEHATTPVENADKTEERKENLASYGISKETRKTIDSHKSNFHQDLDVRGMRGDEALNAVQYFIDDAILVGMPRVRILHGKGNGILRQLIRQYLSSVPNVTHYADEHVQFGGSGITVVDF